MKEIERKFLVRDVGVLVGRRGTRLVQGYLGSDGATTRVRIAPPQAWLTIKGKASGLVRDEYEYAIPLADAQEMLTRHCGDRVVYKTRYRVPVGALTVEVDVFGGKLAGLVLAEVELPHERTPFMPPAWLGQEVTGVKGYSNRRLALQGRPAQWAA